MLLQLSCGLHGGPSFAIVNALGIVFVAVFIQETKGNTLEDNENYYKEHWIEYTF